MSYGFPGVMGSKKLGISCAYLFFGLLLPFHTVTLPSKSWATSEEP